MLTGYLRDSDKRLRRVFLAALVVTAGAVALVAVQFGSGSSGEGPLSNLGADPVGFSIPLDVGESASISGPFVVKNTGDRTIQLDRVELVGLQGGLTLRGAYVVAYPQHPTGPRPRSATIGVDYGYQLSLGDRNLHGATVAPHTQVAIVLGVEAARAGRHAWIAVNVLYHDGGHSYMLRTPVAARICVPKAPYVGQNSRDCPPPDPLKGL